MYSLLTIATVLFSLTSPLSAFPTDPFPGPTNSPRALPTTENGLSGACKDVTLIFARGTNEAGNVGEIAGPPWFNALRTALGTARIAVQGVTYSATITGYLAGGDSAGSKEMLRVINLASSQCPSTKIVLGGYRYDDRSLNSF